MSDFTSSELKMLKSLNTPRKIQLFLNSLPTNYEPHEETCYSPRQVLKHRTCHCIEGAMLAAVCLRLQGQKPLIMDFETIDEEDHVIAIFKQYGHWGAISKTNHAVLRYRDPVYKTVRELAMSYFHEYLDKKGRKTLRTYSNPVNLSQFDHRGWMASEQDVWYVVDHLRKIPHIKICSRPQIASLKNGDPLEVSLGNVIEWKKASYPFL